MDRVRRARCEVGRGQRNRAYILRLIVLRCEARGRRPPLATGRSLSPFCYLLGNTEGRRLLWSDPRESRDGEHHSGTRSTAQPQSQRGIAATSRSGDRAPSYSDAARERVVGAGSVRRSPSARQRITAWFCRSRLRPAIRLIREHSKAPACISWRRTSVWNWQNDMAFSPDRASAACGSLLFPSGPTIVRSPSFAISRPRRIRPTQQRSREGVEASPDSSIP